MTIIREGELEFNFVGAVLVEKLDGPSHGLSHCMKAVDFVVEYPGFLLFVEVKDPDDTSATAERRKEFAKKLATEPFVEGMTKKYRDSWLYTWAEKKLAKPVRYAVLMQLSTLQPPALQNLRDRLRRNVPSGIAVMWKQPIVDEVFVLDMKMWNGLGAFGHVRRL